jgi:hypothetical protein
MPWIAYKIPQPFLPVLGPKGRLLLYVGAGALFGAIPHAHKYDWIWEIDGFVTGVLAIWRSIVSANSDAGGQVVAEQVPAR